MVTVEEEGNLMVRVKAIYGKGKGKQEGKYKYFIQPLTRELLNYLDWKASTRVNYFQGHAKS